MDALNVLNAFFDSMTLKGLYRCQSVLEDKIKAAKSQHKAEVKSANIRDFVQIHDDFIPHDKDSVLFAAVQAEVETFGLGHKSGSKTEAKWLSSDKEPYSWSSSNGQKFVNQSHDISECTAISELMEKINVEFNVDMNSCLVTCFKGASSGIRLHCDDENEIDQQSPICVFTIGEERKVEFLSMYQAASEPPLLSITPKEGSLYLMQPGCQDRFRHRVPSVRNSGSKTGIRYSLSFRKKIPCEPSSASTAKVVLDSPVKAVINKLNKSSCQGPVVFSKGSSSSQNVGTVQQTRSSKSKSKSTAVLFGTSITSRIDSNSISDKNHSFINLLMFQRVVPPWKQSVT